MKKSLFVIATLLISISQSPLAKVVCDESGWNEFGTWSSCLKWHREPGLAEVEYPVDERRVGQVERVQKNIDGSVTVWRHGSPNDEQWKQIDENTWERTR